MSFFSSSLLLFVHSHDLLLCLETAVLAQVSKDCSGESQAAHYCYSQILLLLLLLQRPRSMWRPLLPVLVLLPSTPRVYRPEDGPAFGGGSAADTYSCSDLHPLLPRLLLHRPCQHRRRRRRPVSIMTLRPLCLFFG